MGMVGAIIGSTVVGAGSSAIASSNASNAARDAAETAAGYQPTHLGESDDLAWNLMQQQAAYQPNWSQYDPASQMMMGQYYNMMGQPYSYQTGATQTLNPAYTEYMANQSGNNSGGASGNTGTGVFGGLGGGILEALMRAYQGQWNGQGIGDILGNFSQFLPNRNGQAPEQWLTTPGETTTIEPTGVNYMDYLNQYLTGAFDQGDGSMYDTYLNRAVQGTRSGLSARGLNTSPYGAGIEGETSGEFARQWMLDAQNRQGTALQNYMAGQSGLQSLGQSALTSALALEQLKKGWSQDDINNALAYMGRGQGNPAVAASYINQAGQAAAQPWAQLANNAGQYATDISSLFQPNYNTYTDSQIYNAANTLLAP